MNRLCTPLLLWLSLLPALLWAQTGVSYSYIPKQVYENQLFPVTVISSAVDQNDTVEDLTFDRSSAQKPLFAQPLIVRNGNDVFYTFYFKAGHYTKEHSYIQIPRLFVRTRESQSSLDPMAIPLLSIASLKPDQSFSNIIAASMHIKNYQVSKYDAKSHLVTLSLEAYEANLEDIKAPEGVRYGIEHIHRHHAKVTGDFFVILPRSQKVFTLTYFNSVKHRFIPLTIKVKLANASVTTQSDLNPKVDAFDRLKRYVLSALSLFFILLFLWKRDFFYLVLGVVSLITLLTFYIPHKKICVKKGAALYILPTETSTISTHTTAKLQTALLGEHGNFKKIELKKGVIGWIRDEALCK